MYYIHIYLLFHIFCITPDLGAKLPYVSSSICNVQKVISNMEFVSMRIKMKKGSSPLCTNPAKQSASSRKGMKM